MGQQEPEVEVDAVAVAQKVSAPPGSAAITYGVALPPGSSVAIPAGNAASSVPMWQQEKVGAKCCGCCCDYRRAVIVVTIIGIVVGVMNLITILTVSAVGAAGAIEDDKVEEVYKDSAPFLAAFTAVALLASICGLVGALKFNTCLVAVDLVWMAVNFIVGAVVSMSNANDVDALQDDQVDYKPNPIGDIIFSAVITSLWMYPLVGFIMEVRKGIMSRETYPREEHSCCCVSARV